MATFFKKIESKKVFLIFLWILMFSLPLSEAVKQGGIYLTIFAGLYVIYKEKLEIKKDLINISLGLLVLFSISSSFINIDDESIKNIFKINLDITRISLLFIVIRAINLKKEEYIKYIFIPMFLGFVITLCWGIYNKYILDEIYLKLKSVGHVNHSAIYIVLAFCASLPLVYANKARKNLLFYLFIVTFLLSLLGILIGSSRAAMFPIPVYLLFFLWSSKNLSLKNITFFAILILIFLLIIIYITNNNYIIAKFSQGITDPARYELISSAFFEWQKSNWFFGIGPEHFRSVDIRAYFPDTHTSGHLSHAHNTYATYLIERGVLGLGAYLVFMFSLVIAIFKKRDLVVVQVALLAWLANMIISLGNTTFHHENATLMMVLWALALSQVNGGKDEIDIS